MRKMTDLELTMYLIKEDFDEARGSLETWNRRQRYDNMKSVEALHKMALTIHETVEFELKGNGKPVSGSKPRNILGTLRSERLEKVDGRKGNKRPAAEETTLIREFIFNQLVRIIGDEESVTMPLSKWYEYIGLYSLGHNEVMKFHVLLQDKYRPFHSTIKIKGMREEVKEAMNERINYVHNYAFKQLVKSERIETDRIYKMVICDEMVERMEDDLNEKIDPIQQMSDKMLEDVQVAEAEKAEELGVSFEDYQKARIRPRYAKKAAKKILPEMDEMLIDKFGIKSYFRELEISIIDPSIVRDVSKKEARNVFIDKTIELHLKKCEKEEYTRATTYSKKFFKLNFLLLLQFKGVEGLESEIGTELFTLKFRIDEIRRSYIEELKQEKTDAGTLLMNDIDRANDEVEPSVDEQLGDFFDVSDVNSGHDKMDLTVRAIKSDVTIGKLNTTLIIEETHLEVNIDIREIEVGESNPVSEEMEWLNKFTKYKKAAESVAI